MIEVRLPQWGMGMHDGIIVAWLKSPGEWIAMGEPLVEVEAAKVDGFVESPVDGRIREIRASVGETVAVRQVIAVIDEQGP
jgi:pyruvate/2-oxoglutarate dehydrogenase complex dihydrolipoamide acyltransferase (E2) component